MDLMIKIQNTVDYLNQQLQIQPKLAAPEIGCILGSGLGELADQLHDPVIIPYDEIPHFPISTVEGHAGQLVFGTLLGKKIVAMKGRFHYYEGYSMEEVTFPIRVMKALGVGTLIITNAAGGVNKGFQPGDLMLITDHLHLGFSHPLRGPNDNALGVRFPDMSSAYDQGLISTALEASLEAGIGLRQGVYAYMTGPNYETPAEIKMIERLGGDAVGMSTVPEVMVAVHGQIKVLGISCISNMAAGVLKQPLNHEEVIETTQRVKTQFIQLVKSTIKLL